MSHLREALLSVQSEVTKVFKDGKNLHTKAGYPTLESVYDTIRPVLTKHRIIVSQFTEHTDHGWVLKTTLCTPDDPNTPLTSETPLYGVDGSKNQMQALGSAITYARRYALCSILNLVSTDDDGETLHQDEPETLHFVKPQPAPPLADAIDTFLPPDAPKPAMQTDFKIPEGKYSGKKVSDIPRPELAKYIREKEEICKQAGQAFPPWFQTLRKVVSQ